MTDLPRTPYLAFPFRIDSGTGAPALSPRLLHLREQIEQVLYTNPGERVFRPEFGAGLRNLVFEPNAESLWELTRKRLLSSLTEALHGEVDPKTLQVELDREAMKPGDRLVIEISYTVAAIGHRETHRLEVGPGGGGGG